MAKNYCDKCGDAVDGLEFCANCGEKVWVASPAAVAAAKTKKTGLQVFRSEIKSFFKNYSNFEGRSPVSSFVAPWLMIILFNRFLSLFSSGNDQLTESDYIFFAIQIAGWAAVLMPTLAVMSRRLHDTGRSAKNLWFFALPVVGWVLLLVWCLKKSEPRNNQYGPVPAKA